MGAYTFLKMRPQGNLMVKKTKISLWFPHIIHIKLKKDILSRGGGNPSYRYLPYRLTSSAIIPVMCIIYEITHQNENKTYIFIKLSRDGGNPSTDNCKTN